MLAQPQKRQDSNDNDDCADDPDDIVHELSLAINENDRIAFLKRFTTYELHGTLPHPRAPFANAHKGWSGKLMPRALRQGFGDRDRSPGTAILLSFLTFVLFAAAGDYEAMKKELWLYVASASTGILIWIVVVAVSGKSEGWDSSWYFVAGYPLVCAGAMALGFIAPLRSWRWGLIPFAAQFLWMLLTEGVGNLLPLGIVMFGVLSVPAVVAARVGAFFGNRRTRRSEL